MLLMEHNVLNPKSSFDGSNQVATSAATHKVATFTGLVGLLEILQDHWTHGWSFHVCLARRLDAPAPGPF